MRTTRREFVAFSIAAAGAGKAWAAEPPWAELRAGRATALLRHAEAPGVGDPPGFDLADCSTQRNLSEAGQVQARTIGDLFRANGIGAAAVYSSRWCRCLDTAKLLGLGDVILLDHLNSLFGEGDEAAARSAALLAWHRGQRFAAPAVLVTHQVNITRLTGLGASSGEIVFVRIPAESEIEVIGRVATAA
ncbi:MAG TPA: histidine phosphatase family protein [Reyranella sp.]|nr:histidine phosphatase family protein [Reyranella sp.]